MAYLPGRFERQVEEGLTYVAATPRFIRAGTRELGHVAARESEFTIVRSVGPLQTRAHTGEGEGTF